LTSQTCKTDSIGVGLSVLGKRTNEIGRKKPLKIVVGEAFDVVHIRFEEKWPRPSSHALISFLRWAQDQLGHTDQSTMHRC